MARPARRRSSREGRGRVTNSWNDLGTDSPPPAGKLPLVTHSTLAEPLSPPSETTTAERHPTTPSQYGESSRKQRHHQIKPWHEAAYWPRRR